MSINKPRIFKEQAADEPSQRAVMKQKPKHDASHAKERPGTKGQKPDETGPETWPGGVDRFHENL